METVYFFKQLQYFSLFIKNSELGQMAMVPGLVHPVGVPVGADLVAVLAADLL